MRVLRVLHAQAFLKKFFKQPLVLIVAEDNAGDKSSENALLTRGKHANVNGERPRRVFVLNGRCACLVLCVTLKHILFEYRRAS